MFPLCISHCDDDSDDEYDSNPEKIHCLTPNQSGSIGVSKQAAVRAEEPRVAREHPDAAEGARARVAMGRRRSATVRKLVGATPHV
jgi:hypothetical protein